jgi:hypothetical protein
MGTEALSLGVMRPGREAVHSTPASAEVKKMWIYTCTPINLHGAVLNWFSAEVKKMWIYTCTPIKLHGVVLNWLSTETTVPLPTSTMLLGII